jgi:ArsR family transcriptional regulator
LPPYRKKTLHSHRRPDRFTRIFEALGEPTRLRIMELLPREPRCMDMYNVIELAAELGLSQPTVSHHLKMLHRAGLVKSRRQCNSVYFYTDVQAVDRWLAAAAKRLGRAATSR